MPNPLPIAGDLAHDAAESQHPVPFGAVAVTTADTAPANRVSADGDRVRLAASRDGAAYSLPHGPQTWSYKLRSSSQQVNTVVHAAPGAGLKIYITDIYVAAGGAVTITLEDEDDNYIWAYPAQAAGNGAKDERRAPIDLPANKALELDTSAAVQVYVTLSGYIAP